MATVWGLSRSDDRSEHEHAEEGPREFEGS